jgi:Cdc6-like AAA superfamily ATPase
MNDIATLTASAIDRMAELIASAPAGDTPIPDSGPASRVVMPHTGLPKRYRGEWLRPVDRLWCDRFAKIMRLVSDGGIGALIGPRGTGKTRLAGEVMRNFAPHAGHYTTAMGLFLRIRSSFGKSSTESEESIVNELSRVPLLVLDEIQERGNSGWEDRILTHLLDRRYGAERATLIIANLTVTALTESLGDSIVSRLNETGGILEVTGPSFRDLPQP